MMLFCQNFIVLTANPLKIISDSLIEKSNGRSRHGIEHNLNEKMFFQETGLYSPFFQFFQNGEKEEKKNSSILYHLSP